MPTASPHPEAFDHRPLLSRVAVAAVGVVASLVLAGTVMSVRFGPALSELSGHEPVGPGFFLGLLPFGLSGGYLAWRRPSNAVGWWLLTAAFFWIAQFVGVTYGLAGLATVHGPLLWSLPVYLVAVVMWAPGFLAIGMVVFLFPNGKPLSPRWNWVVVTAVTVTIVLCISTLLLPDILEAGVANPIAWGAAESVFGLISGLSGIALFALGVIAAVALVFRFLRAGSTERLQIKWFLFPVLAAVVAAVLGSLRDLVGWQSISPLIDGIQAVGLVAVVLIPVAIAIAVMRYGLYDLGRIVNRTVVYALVAVLLAAVYTGSVLVLTAILPGSDNPFAVATSTLAAAALFSPLRSRVQRLVNKRLYRQAYDADRVQRQLHDRLQESIQPESVAQELLDAADSTFRPERSGIWLRRGPTGRVDDR